MSLMQILCILLSANMCLAAIVELQDGGNSVGNDSSNSSCEYKGVVNITVHVGWPFYFTCKDLVDQLQLEVGYIKFITKYSKENTTCTLRDENGTKQWMITAKLEELKSLTRVSYPGIFDVADVAPTYHRMEINIAAVNHCSYQDIHLQPEIYVNNHTCESLESFPTTIKQLGKGSANRMHCTLDYGVTPLLYFQDANIDDITYEWTHNCENNLPNNSRVIGDELIIREAEFGIHGGTYACSVKYKGHRRFVTRHEICIKHNNAGQFSVKCPDKVEAKIGSDVNITCNVDFGPGPFTRLLGFSTWNKTIHSGDNYIFCVHWGISNYGDEYFKATNSTIDERAKCETVQISNINERCFLQNPSDEEKEAMKRLTRITLLIKKMKKEDAASYTLVFSSGTPEVITSTIILAIDVDDILIDNIKYIAVGVLVLVLLLIVIILCIWRRTDLLWLIKKYFGAYEKVELKYTAYISYHFSSENMSEKSQNLTNNVINGLYSFFNDFGGKVYDDHKDGNELQLHIENMAQVQKECHRIIIILNPEYVTDNWCLHKAYSALRNMVEGGAKVIFIALPGVEKSFNQIDNEPKSALKHAMKMNTTIHWSGETPLSGSFVRNLEYALPKIRKNKKHEIQIEPKEKMMMMENIHAA